VAFTFRSPPRARQAYEVLPRHDPGHCCRYQGRSPTYGRYVAAELSEANWRQLWIPPGFAHGYATLEEKSEVIYKVTDYYAPDCDRGILWDDPALGSTGGLRRETSSCRTRTGISHVLPILLVRFILSAREQAHAGARRGWCWLHWLGGLPALHFRPRYEVVLDKMTYAGNMASLVPAAATPGFVFAKLDICDSVAMTAVFAKCRPDAVLHLAAESHVDRSISGSSVFVNTNVVGTFTLLEAARHYVASERRGEMESFRFLHVSTDEVFGSLGEDGLFAEATAYDPSSPYSASKAVSDHPGPGTGPMACRSLFRTAPITMARITFQKN
jgi:GDP-mannose 4,6 dehydratase/dTDP-4-dehydrorhamnose 3,5-epimerase